MTDPAPSPPNWRARFDPLAIGQAISVMLFASFCLLWPQWIYRNPVVTQISGDFVSFWTAGRLALAGRAADAYSEPPHMAAQLALHGDPNWGYLAFFYPPFFLLLCAAFAAVGYLPALGLWMASTMAAYAAALRALASERRVWTLFLGYPAVLVNAGYGQNGLLSTALLGGAAIWLDRRPALAGACLGLLAYKPHLGVIVPLALAVAGRWRCFAAASATVLALCLAASLVFGTGIWEAFFANTQHARRWMEVMDPNYLAKWITVYGAIRLHGGSVALAYGAQALVSLAAAAALLWTLHRVRASASGPAILAAIAACVPFCSPFLLEYDLVVLAIPMAWLLNAALRSGFRRGEKLALLAAYAAPALFKLTLLDNALKLSVIVASALLLGAVLRRVAYPAA